MNLSGAIRMSRSLSLDDVEAVANAGFFVALRVGFAYPMEEVNRFPEGWIETYTRQGLMMFDPVIRWAYGNTGAASWDTLRADDPHGILKRAEGFGLRYGVAISIFDNASGGQRSFGSFARHDRPFVEEEVAKLEHFLKTRHRELAPPDNLTPAELIALQRVKEGDRLKQIAFELSVSEGAVKQRLKSAKDKLGARTSTQAAALAAQYGLI